MKILLIETSSADVGFAYCDSGTILHEKKLNRESNADSLIYTIREDFDTLGLEFNSIEVVSFSAGPGSFTGLRIGLAVAKGICYALGCRLVMVPTLDVIANKAVSANIIVPLIFSNMRSAEFYYAEYTKENNKLERTSVYGIKKFVELEKDGREFFIDGSFEGSYEGIKDISGISGLRSLLDLTLKYITGNSFSDISTSEPFYLKDFEPVKVNKLKQ